VLVEVVVDDMVVAGLEDVMLEEDVEEDVLELVEVGSEVLDVDAVEEDSVDEVTVADAVVDDSDDVVLDDDVSDDVVEDVVIGSAGELVELLVVVIVGSLEVEDDSILVLDVEEVVEMVGSLDVEVEESVADVFSTVEVVVEEVVVVGSVNVEVEEVVSEIVVSVELVEE
jgi:hypothetical protein